MYLIRLLGGLNELISIKSLGQWLAYSKYHMTVIFLLFYKMPQILLKIKMDIHNYCHHHPKHHVDINV